METWKIGSKRVPTFSSKLHPTVIANNTILSIFRVRLYQKILQYLPLMKTHCHYSVDNVLFETYLTHVCICVGALHREKFFNRKEEANFGVNVNQLLQVRGLRGVTLACQDWHSPHVLQEDKHHWSKSIVHWPVLFSWNPKWHPIHIIYPSYILWFSNREEVQVHLTIDQGELVSSHNTPTTCSNESSIIAWSSQWLSVPGRLPLYS